MGWSIVLWLSTLWIGLGWSLGVSSLAVTTVPTTAPNALPTIPSPSTCPKDLKTLIPLLLQDLPSYANRTSQRALRRERAVNLSSYMLVAGQAETLPLSLGPGMYAPIPPDSAQLQQVFITTLGRTYLGDQAVELQQFHWLFLTLTQNGWRLAMMYSQTGGYPKDQPPTPPRESTQGAVGQAVSLWLRDCQAGVLRRQPAGQ
ncbi:MAG: hypothetical protein VKJ46_03560 [Leptolyngbyaceae bacterium]|nr:hypothetical protein [Leptolyngbyaceae bacterium]